ncbi:porin [Pluralibacter gergoviae]|uniref:OprD family outer membrane porin n=1 Tax=Pluralibacter gergoviae TaxID=61647 RepID=UPI0005EC5867|nr:OprD family outer membrane porin [Pluralibacter gergoviae]KJM62971.1 porin [Pluralibacter gergoviae]OUR02477.1 porin [Pluralibacter gergoviae]
MRAFKYTLLVLMLAGNSCAWAQNTKPSQSESGNYAPLSVNPFFSDASLTLELKNMWKYLKEDEGEEKNVHAAWGQGFSLDYRSGYFMDVIGADLVYYGAVALGASDRFSSRGVLYNKGTGSRKGNAEGFSKFGKRNIKLKYEAGDVNLNARWGWQRIRNLGVITTSTRLSPTTYLGWSGSLGYRGLTLSGAWIDSSIDRSGPDKRSFTTNTGKKISRIASGALAWKTDPLDVTWGYGESDNYLRRHILLTEFKPRDTLHIGSQIYATHALGDYKAMPVGRRDFDNNAWHFALDGIWKGSGWGSKWGIGYTDAKKRGMVGHYPRHMSKNSRGTFISMANAGNDYMRDGEVMLANMSDYMLTPALAIGFAGNVAQFSYRGNKVRTGEVNLFSRWAPTHPTLKNLIVWGMFGPGWSYKTAGGKTPKLVNGRYQRAHTLAGEVIVEYKFSLF